MAAVNIHTGPGGLMAVESSASAATLDAYFYTFTKAQMVARTADADPTTSAYFDAFVQSLATLGWTTIPGPMVLHSSGPDGPAPLQACADAVIGAVQRAMPYLPIPKDAIRQAAAALATALGDAPPAVSAQLDSWWSLGSVSVEDRIFSIGPILEILNTPVVPAVHLEVALTATSWRSLIEPAPDFAFSITPVLLTLKWAAYEAIAQQLEDELAATLSDHIRTAALDLGSGRLAALS